MVSLAYAVVAVVGIIATYAVVFSIGFSVGRSACSKSHPEE